MVKKFNLLFFCMAVIIGLLQPQDMQAQSRATAPISAEVIDVTTATEETELNFGLCAPGPEGGQVLISPHGNIATMGTVVAIGDKSTPARFYITGIKEKAFSITLSSDPVILSHNDNGNTTTLLVHGWETIPSANSGSWTLEDGALAVNVGAILDVNDANENPVGIYAGSYSITFDYN